MKKIIFFFTALILLSACQTIPFTPPPTGRSIPVSAPPVLPFPQSVPRIVEPPAPLPPVPVNQNDAEAACTKEYRPVCGKIAIVCITTPCDPVDETFNNECMAKARGAYDIRQGACAASE